MRHHATCSVEGCGFFIRAPDRETAATWLYRHLVSAHGRSMGELSFDEVREVPVLAESDNGPWVGMPWAVDADGKRRTPF